MNKTQLINPQYCQCTTSKLCDYCKSKYKFFVGYKRTSKYFRFRGDNHEKSIL